MCVSFYDKFVVHHSLHIGLYDSLQLPLISHDFLTLGCRKSELSVGFQEVMAQEPVGAEVIYSVHVVAVELQEIVAFDKLIQPAAGVVDSPCLLGRGVQEVDAPRNVRFGIAKPPEDGGQDVRLLCYAVHSSARHLAGRVEEKQWRTEQSEVRTVLGMVGDVGVIAGEDKDCVLVPRLFPRCLKELPQRHVRIANALMDRVCALFLINILVLLRHNIRVMTGGGEDRGDERLAELRHLHGVELQERLVPDGPCAVVLPFSAEARVTVELRPAVVILVACRLCERLKAHAAVLRAMEKAE